MWLEWRLDGSEQGFAGVEVKGIAGCNPIRKNCPQATRGGLLQNRLSVRSPGGKGTARGLGTVFAPAGRDHPICVKRGWLKPEVPHTPWRNYWWLCYVEVSRIAHLRSGIRTPHHDELVSAVSPPIKQLCLVWWVQRGVAIFLSPPTKQDASTGLPHALPQL